MKLSNIENSQVTTTSSKPVRFWKKPEFKLAAAIILMLIGVSVLAVGLTGLMPVWPGVILGGVLLSVATVGLTIGVLHLHKRRKAISPSRKRPIDPSRTDRSYSPSIRSQSSRGSSSERVVDPSHVDKSPSASPRSSSSERVVDPSHVDKSPSTVRAARRLFFSARREEIIADIIANDNSLPKFNTPFEIDFAVGPTPEQAKAAHELHLAVRSMLESGKDYDRLRCENGWALKALKVTMLSSNDRFRKSRDLVFSSEYFPGVVFKSRPEAVARASVEKSILAEKVVQENSLDLLHVPVSLFLEGMTVGNWGLVIQEKLSRVFQGQGLLPYGVEDERDQLKNRTPACCQLIKFMTLTFASYDLDDFLILETPPSQKETVIGILHQDNLKGPVGDHANLGYLENLLIKWMERSQRLVGEEMAKACYEACPTKKMKRFLSSIVTNFDPE